MKNMSELSKTKDKDILIKNRSKIRSTPSPTPKSREQIIKDLNQLREHSHLKKTDGSMKFTHNVVKRIGSLTDVWTDMRETEKQ